jgi:hypothetical protein
MDNHPSPKFWRKTTIGPKANGKGAMNNINHLDD